jgi:DNA-binding HxlR family transcriptional regulator
MRKENSTYTQNETHLGECDLSYGIARIGGRWKLQIISSLENRVLRYSELKKELPMITERILALQLRTLEKDGLVTRTVHAEVPPRVEYELSPMALQLIPIFKQLSDWGARHRMASRQHTKAT